MSLRRGHPESYMKRIARSLTELTRGVLVRTPNILATLTGQDSNLDKLAFV